MSKRNLVIFILILGACVEHPSPERKNPDKQQLKEQFIRANRHNLQKEKDVIEQYIRVHRQPYEYTPEGIYFFKVFHARSTTDSIRQGDRIKVKYNIYLLDGTLCYSVGSDKTPVSITVEKDYTESGIHRGLQRMRVGDRVRMIIPSYLAHGLLGDGNKIPPQSPILVDITVFEKE